MIWFGKMTNSIKLTFKYFLLVLLLSLPFFILGAFTGGTKNFLINLPVSALMFICPTLALLFFDKVSFKQSLINIFDFKKIKNLIWILVIVLSLPLLMFVTFLTMKFTGVILPDIEFKLLETVILFVLFFFAATFEELGWTGYLTRQLLKSNTIVVAGATIGILWAIWHIIPYLQEDKSFVWIFWQCATAILLRILMVWVFVRSGASLFLIILFHTMINMVVNDKLNKTDT
ncbi:MAG: CPBP family intramembrane metalloprotease [Agriterribacter sp.]